MSDRFKFRIYSFLEKSFYFFSIGDGEDGYPQGLAGGVSEIQQYTGLTDSKGKEIYEGDIVKYARTKVESTEFAKGCFKNHLIEIGEEIGEILFIKPSFCLSFDHIRYDDIMPMCLAEHRYEVIGNVFEAPKLIKKL